MHPLFKLTPRPCKKPLSFLTEYCSLPSIKFILTFQELLLKFSKDKDVIEENYSKNYICNNFTNCHFQNVTRTSPVESFTGKKFFLVEVIAYILKYLKDSLIKHLAPTVRPLKTTDFDWVITVPAIWDARGKRMMREAAYLVNSFQLKSYVIFSYRLD